jgi:hypothetical protein
VVVDEVAGAADASRRVGGRDQIWHLRGDQPLGAEQLDDAARDGVDLGGGQLAFLARSAARMAAVPVKRDARPAFLGSSIPSTGGEESYESNQVMSRRSSRFS